MTENKINPLLDAIGEIDDSIIGNAKKPKKRPLLIIAAAAAVTAAAALMMIAGAESTNKSYLELRNHQRVMDYNVIVQNGVNTDPHDRLLEMGAETDPRADRSLYYDLNARPSEVFELLNVNVLMNDRFTDEETQILVEFGNVHSADNWNYLELHYSLTDKETGLTIHFLVCIKLGEDGDIVFCHQEAKEFEHMDLNDGSKMMYYAGNEEEYGTRYYGTFSYGGIIYDYSTFHTDYDTFLQTIEDLGIL